MCAASTYRRQRTVIARQLFQAVGSNPRSIAAEITAQFLDAVLRGFASLIVKMHDLMFIPVCLQIQIGGQRMVQMVPFLGACISSR